MAPETTYHNRKLRKETVSYTAVLYYNVLLKTVVDEIIFVC